jgi:PTH1 family peptidyl-tRNA hydrolase
VGLGNPGADYAQTRHNVGFMVVERFGARQRAKWTRQEKFRARLARFEWAGRKVFLCQPQTYMNLSGAAVQAVSAYFKIVRGNLLMVVDDADLALGQIRMRPRGSSGGHHGLESVEEHLTTRDYARLRIGIGRQSEGAREITNYVLGRFAPDETEILKTVLERAADQIECWLTAGVEKAMNQFNGAIDVPSAKES